jgi:hypothetical protein
MFKDLKKKLANWFLMGSICLLVIVVGWGLTTYLTQSPTDMLIESFELNKVKPVDKDDKNSQNITIIINEKEKK